jgi:hypothetical protein
VDYLLPLDNAVVPIEVKSGATGRLRSLRAFLDEKKGRAPYGIRFCGQPPSVHGDLHSYPLYAVPHVLRGQIPRDWLVPDSDAKQRGAGVPVSSAPNSRNFANNAR